MEVSDCILVTGGAGFIGSHAVDALLDQGCRVKVLDNLSTGKLSNLPVGHPELTFIEGDVTDPAVVSYAAQGCTAVLHLAAVASVQASVDDPAGTHRSNFIGTLNLCETMVKYGIKRVVYASSAAVYGNNSIGEPIDEEVPLKPLTPYAADKLAGEFYLDFYRRQHGIQPTIFRFFNIFGTRQDPSSPYSGVISIFTKRAVDNLPITVYGDGQQTRDFVHVKDLVSLLMQALSSGSTSNLPMNVGFKQKTSLNEILENIQTTLGRPLDLRYVEARSGDIRHSLACNEKLKQQYKFVQTVTMAQGLAELLE